MKKQMATGVLEAKPQVTPVRVLKSNVKWFNENNAQGQCFGGNHGYQYARWWICCRPYCTLSHWGRDKMAAILKTIFSNVFPCMEIVVFWFKFHSQFVPKCPVNINPASSQGRRHQVILWTNDGQNNLPKVADIITKTGRWSHYGALEVSPSHFYITLWTYLHFTRIVKWSPWSSERQLNT